MGKKFAGRSYKCDFSEQPKRERESARNLSAKRREISQIERERERGRVDRGTETEAQRRSPPSKEQKNIILLF